MGKKSKKGQHHNADHAHHKAGQGSHSHHKHHGGPLYDKYHRHKKGSAVVDESQEADSEPISTATEETAVPAAVAVTTPGTEDETPVEAKDDADEKPIANESPEDVVAPAVEEEVKPKEAEVAAEEAPVVNERSLLLASPDENEATHKEDEVAIGICGTLITWLDIQWIAVLAAALELLLCIMHFGFGWKAAKLGPLHWHHAYFGIAILVVLLYRPIPVQQQGDNQQFTKWMWAFRVAWALILADFVHHFFILWPVTGDPQL